MKDSKRDYCTPPKKNTALLRDFSNPLSFTFNEADIGTIFHCFIAL